MKQILFFLFLLSSCTPKEYSLPDWYLTPVNNNAQKLYGIGYGSNLEDATKFALNNMSERLKVEISSSFQTYKQEAVVNDNSEFSYNVNQRVKAKVKEIEFNNYFIENTAEHNKQFYVLLSVNKAELVDNYADKIAKRQVKLEASLSALKGKSIIKQLSLYNEIIEPIKDNEARIALIRNITKDRRRLSNLTTLYQKIIADQAANKSKLIVNLAAKPSDKRIADLLSASLNKLKISTSEAAETPNDNRVAILMISSETTHQKIYSAHVVKLVINLKLVEKFGKQIASNQIEISASSSLSSNEAINAAIVKLKRKINTEQIYNILGL